MGCSLIEIESVTWRNFISYGDYTTELQLADLGQCLITGEVLKPRGGQDAFELARDKELSNGAGKSNVPNAILWGLFGRTMHRAAPGTKVINWYSQGDCAVEITFKNRDRITRTISREGRTELIYTREGNETRYAADTIATTKLQQQKLNREFGLDWDLFTGHAFLTQYNRPWMEMPDQARKQAMERMLHVDRFTLYGQVAGEKATKLDQERAKYRARLAGLDADLMRVDEDLEGLRETLNGYEAAKEGRHREALRRADEAAGKRDAIQLPDIVKVTAQWEVVTKVRGKVTELLSEAQRHRERANVHRLDRDSQRRQAEDYQARIARWEQKLGKECIQCEQAVPQDHVAGKVEPLQSKVAEWETMAEGSEQQRLAAAAAAATKDREASDLKERLEAKLPKLTIQDAQYAHREWRIHDKEVYRHRLEAEAILAEVNPHHVAITRTEKRKAALYTEKTGLTDTVEEYTSLWKHWTYIQKAHSDRKKMKSFAIAPHLDYVNSRLAYYLDVFELDLSMQFTTSLGIENSKWEYDFYCGGERKRTDLAIMFAMFDLHEKMYGRQSNIMVLDEVDGRMDGAGIQSLIQIIKNDLSTKVETLLIISHKSNLRDVFSRQIHIKRDGRYSQLAEVR